MKSTSKFDDFGLAKKFARANRLLQVILLISFIIGVNLFSQRFSMLWDLSVDNANTLSAESIANLEQIEGEISIHVVTVKDLKLPNGRMVNLDLGPLVEQFRHQANRLGLGKFEIQEVQMFRDRDLLLQLKESFGFDQENVVLVGSGDRKQIIPIADFYQKNEEGDLEFSGEQVLMASILEVNDPLKKKVLFTVGQGEMLLDDTDSERGLSELHDFLQNRNLEVGTIDLSRYDRIPESTDLLIITSPQASFSETDVEKLRKYLEKANGSILLYLEPFRKHNLDALLSDWGVLEENSVIMDPGPDYQSSSGNLIIRRFGEHPVTETLISNKLYVYSTQLRPIRPDPANPGLAGVKRFVLLGTSETSWVETDYRNESVPTFDAVRDVAGPIPVGLLSERSGAEALGLKLKGGKLIVFGDASIVSNRLFDRYGNRVLFANSLNWTLQKRHLLNIPPEKIESYRLTISEGDLNNLLFALMLMPAAFAVVGLFFRIVRR